MTTGGVTYPQTGCNIDNFSLIKEPLTKIKYGLSPLITKENLSKIAGITLNNVECSYKKSKVKGNVLISHVGLTGPGIIDLSSIISKKMDYNINFHKYILKYSHHQLKLMILIQLSNKHLKSNF